MRISRVKEFLKRHGLLQAPCAPNKTGRGRRCNLLDGHGAGAGEVAWEGSGGRRGGTSWGEQASASAAWEVSPEDRRWGGAEEPAPLGPRGKGLRSARVRSGGPAFRPGESRVELGCFQVLGSPRGVSGGEDWWGRAEKTDSPLTSPRVWGL